LAEELIQDVSLKANHEAVSLGKVRLAGAFFDLIKVQIGYVKAEAARRRWGS